MSIYTPKTVTLRDGAAVTLRSPEVDEAEQLLEYLDAVRRETDGIMFSPEDRIFSVEQERDWIKGKRDAEAGVHIAAEADGKVIALAGIDQPHFARQRHIGSLGISVRKQWCGRGLGMMIMRELIHHARHDPALELLTLTVFESNPRARAVYRKVGFKEDGLLPGRVKIDGVYRDIVVMSLWLRDMRTAS